MIFNMADGIITPCNVAWSWHWFRQVTAPCNICGMWLCLLWNHDSKFTKCQHPAMWQVALGWHAMEFAQTSAILEFYIWFRVWPYYRSRHVILHQFAKFYLNRTTLSRKKWRHVDFQDGGSQPSWILGVQLWVFWMAHVRLPIGRQSLNCWVVEKITFLQFGDRQRERETNRQTNRWTGPMHEAALAVASGGLINWR